MLQKKVLTEAEKEAQRQKCEIAKELGLWEKIEELGFRGLTSRESGRIGGIISKRKREAAKIGGEPCNQAEKEI